MSVREPELDFLRFREDGDSEALARVFDALAPELLLLAHHLIRDASQAEDLVQATFVAAIEDAARFDSQRRLRPWLAGILANRAKDLARRERVRRPKSLDEASHVADPSDPSDRLASIEAIERIGAALEQLPDSYRRVLVLRLVHGLTPIEIAHSLGEPPGTVRMRQKRGLERLRAALPREMAIGALVFVQPDRSLAAVREAVLGLARPTAAAAPLPGIAGVVRAGLGGLTVMKATTLVLLGIVALTAIWHANSAPEPEGAPPSTEVVAKGAGSTAREPRTALEAPTPASERAEPAAPPGEAAAQEPRLAVRVTRASEGSPASKEPVAKVGVYVRPLRGAVPGRSQRTDASGTAHFSGLARGLYAVELDRWAAPPSYVELRDAQELELVLPAGVHVRGRVVDREGGPVAKASVLRFTPSHEDGLQPLCTADDEGRFELRDVAPGTQLVARARGHQPSEASRGRGSIRGAPGEEVDVELTLGAPGARLEGVVRSSDGSPVPHAFVVVGVDEDARESTWSGPPLPDERREKAPDLEGLLLRADGAGRFASDEVPPGRVRVFARPPEGFPAVFGQTNLSLREGAEPLSGSVGFALVDVAPGVPGHVEVVLREGGSISGTVLDAARQPVAGVVVEAEWEGTDDLGQTEDELGGWACDRRVTSGPDGRYVLAGLLPGEYDLRVQRPGAERWIELAREERELTAGESVRWDAVVEPGSDLTLRVLDPGGGPLAGWRVGYLREDRNEIELARGAADAEGRIVIEGLAPKAAGYTLAVLPPQRGELHGLPVAWREGARSGEAFEVRLEASEMPTARFFGRLQDASGGVLADLELVVASEGARVARETERLFADAEGRFESRGMPGGAFTLLCMDPRYPSETALGTWTLSPGQELDLGSVTLADPGWLTVRVRSSDAAELERASVRVVSADGGTRWLDVGSDGSTRREALWAGEYVVEAGARGHRSVEGRVRIENGSERRIELVCPVDSDGR